MDISQVLWKLVIKITHCKPMIGNYKDELDKTNKRFKELGMKTQIFIGYDRDFGEDIHCNYDHNDALLFDINFFYSFLKIFSSGNYAIYFGIYDRPKYEYIHIINECFERNSLPYMCKIVQDEIKLYEVVLEEYSLL